MHKGNGRPRLMYTPGCVAFGYLCHIGIRLQETAQASKNFESMNKIKFNVKHQFKRQLSNLMNKNTLIDLLQAINFGDMILPVNAAVVGSVGADETDPPVDSLIHGSYW